MRRVWLIVVMTTLALVVCACGGPVAPDVTGVSLPSATAALKQSGHTVGSVIHAEASTQPSGTVVEQWPKAGDPAEEGGRFILTVAGPIPSAEPTQTTDTSDATGKKVRVPGVKGRTESRAKQRLKAAGFKVRVKRAHSSKDAGTVIAQKPSKGTARTGSSVTITVSRGGGSDSEAMSAGDAAAARAYEQHKDGITLKGKGTVERVLADDNDGDRHQRFILALASGQTLLIAHNIDIAPRITSLQPGDVVSFKGIYEWNSQGGVVHWTHHDPDGSHPAGWLNHGGNTYR